MKIIGITGGIGVGKSTVSSILKEFGAYIIDADKIAKDITSKDGEVFKELITFFGDGVLDSGGNLDRKKLAEIVFDNQSELDRLNTITHKKVCKRMRDEIQSLKEKGYEGMVVLDVPIPTSEFKQMTDEIWVVVAEIDKKIDRVQKRGFSKEEALKRINMQMTEKQYIDIADKIIQNNGTLDELKTNVYAYLHK